MTQPPPKPVPETAPAPDRERRPELKTGKTSLRRLFLSLIVTGIVLLSGLAQAAGMASPPLPQTESPTRLSRLAEQWLTTRHPWQEPGLDVHVEAQPLDPRTRLPACRQEVVISLPPGQTIGARTLLQLQCPDQPGWRLLQVVSIQARAEVLVANQAIPAGTQLTQVLTSRQWRDVAALSQGYLDPARVDAMRARMTIPAGAVIALPWVQALPLVRRNQLINLQARLGGIVIGMAGEALSDGALGEHIRVRNRQSGKIVEGTVTADGLVDMQP